MENTADLITRVLAPDAIDDAVLDAIVLSACADGMSKSELEALEQMAKELPSLAGKDEGLILDRIRASFERVEKEGLEGRLKSLAHESMDALARRRIFTAATIIQYADGHVTNEENEFLLDLADVLKLDAAIVKDVVDEIERSVGIKRSKPPAK
jgi:tellurite resistance protein